MNSMGVPPNTVKSLTTKVPKKLWAVAIGGLVPLVAAGLLALFCGLLSGCGGGGAQSSPVITPNPIPSIQSVSPSFVPVGTSSQTITITGSGFLPSSMVTFNGNSRAATHVSEQQLTVVLSGTDLATAGNYSIVVTNPPPGGGQSATGKFSVWNKLSDATGGFSVLFPPSLYNVTGANGPAHSFDFASSPNGVTIGGAIPGSGSSTENSSGFDINVYYTPYNVSGTFDVNGYISATYPGRIIGAVTPVTIGGQQAFELTFQQEEGGGHPDVIVYHNGLVYEISYDSTANVAGFSDAPGLSIFTQVIQNFTFSR